MSPDISLLFADNYVNKCIIKVDLVIAEQQLKKKFLSSYLADFSFNETVKPLKINLQRWLLNQ